MKRFRAKLLLLFTTFFVGVTAYYVYYLLPAPVETQRPPQVATPVSEQISNSPEEKPKESDFYHISACDEPNSFKQYSARARGTISGGVVNHRVVCGDLPEPFQNPTNVSGTVTVYVLIDQFGTVKDARIMNGHKLLNKSVLRAARQIRFAPFILGGEPVKVRGVLIYKFDGEGKVGLQKMKIPI